ncbi:YtxH domain-containing protein [Bacillus solitudinis]|uniref:YtxH domain-containing protein n=1 Tax=Bacillus solitudinis TaxID=2014074 RepID=UPI0012FE19C7|nr:YtxH domain-containing protein [Bacillus solitudinis]
MFTSKRTSSRGYIVGTVLGGFIGAAGALMLAPEKGTDLRKQLSGKLQQARRSNGKLSQTLVELGKEWSEDIEEIMNVNKGQSKKDQSTTDEKHVNSNKNDQGELGALIQGALDEQNNVEDTQQ